MKNLLLSAIFLILILPFGADARPQKYKKPLPFKYDVRIGVSGVPLYPELNYGFPSDIETNRLDDMYNRYQGDKFTTGNITAEFNFAFKKWFTLSLGASFQNTYFNVYDPRLGLVGRHNDAQFSLVPQARFFWANTNYVRMYSSLGLGISIIPDGLYPIFQIAPLGIEVGKKVYGFAEYGFGTHYIGGGIGIGYRF